MVTLSCGWLSRIHYLLSAPSQVWPGIRNGFREVESKQRCRGGESRLRLKTQIDTFAFGYAASAGGSASVDASRVQHKYE